MSVKRIILIGPMGAGKTCVGKKLAQHIGWDFFDSDTCIESKTGVDIPTIFEIEGENGFRERETRVLEELTKLSNIVLATGGGAVKRQENHPLLQCDSAIIYLSAKVKTQLKRTHRDRNRPLLRTDDRRATLNALAKERTPIYEKLADLTIATDDQSIGNSIKFILRELTEKNIISEQNATQQ